MEQLYKQYFYPNAKQFYEILKQHNVKASHKEVKDFINKQAVNQVHKPVNKYKREERPIYASYENKEIQLDLLDYTKYKTYNKNYSWILIGIDIFTRKGYATPIKSKTPTNVEEGFKKFKLKPSSVLHDDGSEFKGTFLKYLKEQNIQNIVINSKYHHTLGVVDRFSKTIKNKIEKLITDTNSLNWINDLNAIVENYNNTPHSGIENIKPIVANKGQNQKDISNLNFWKAVKNNELNDKIDNKIDDGNLVRVKVDKNVLSKGYSNTYSKKVFNVISVDGNKLKLDNNKVVNKKDVIKVPEGSISIKDDIQQKAKIRKKLQKELPFAGWF